MDAPASPLTLADLGGLVVTDDGRQVLVSDRCTGALTVLAFVLGVLAVVVGGFGLVAVMARIAAMTFSTVRKSRRRRAQPLHECRPVAVIDRTLRMFSYGGGAVVTFDHVRFARKLQIGSSSPKLVAVTPGGSHVLKRGNPFDGGVGTVDELPSSVVTGN